MGRRPRKERRRATFGVSWRCRQEHPIDAATLTRLITVGRSLLSELDLDALLARVLDEARELTEARYAAVGILDARRDGLERFLTSGVPEHERAAIGDLPRGRGVLGVLIDEPAPLRLEDVGAHPRSYGFPVNHPPMRSFLGVPVLVGGQAWGNIYLTEKATGTFTAADEEAMVVLADWVAIAVTNARLYRDVAGRRDELERTVRALETTTQISSAIGGEIELERILELLAKRGRALVSARTVVIALLAGDDIEIAVTAGDAPEDVTGRRTPVERSSLGGVLRSRRPERLTDLLRRTDGLPAELGAEAGLLVPLLHRGRPVGVLAAFDRLQEGPEFSADDERLLQAFAASAATAVATAQTVASQSLERSIRAAEAERTRWARELHDETLQELAALRLLLTAAQRTGADEPRALAQAAALVGDTIASLRSLVTDLRPAALDEIGVAAALEALTARVRSRADVEVTLDADLDFERGRAATRHLPELEEAVYRIVQEAATNAVKHGAPRTVAVEVVERDGDVRVTVTDDGTGFDPQVRAAGFGLIGMRERVALAQGTLHVRSAPGAGATVEAVLPVRRRDPGAAVPHASRTG